MALTTPILLKVPNFDATKKQVFKFIVPPGGTQVTSNKLTIKRQSDGAILANRRIQTFKYEHLLNANVLTNGEYYNATISTGDANENRSEQSNTIQFRCYSEPTLKFTNIPDTGVIGNSSYYFGIQYNQLQGEKLNSFVINLYNAAQVLTSSSGVQLTKVQELPYDDGYLFTGLSNDTTYYIEAIGKTVGDTEITTGKIKIDIHYSRPGLFTLLELKNNCSEGYISVTSNIQLVEGETGKPSKYVDNREIDLKNNYVLWNKGYEIGEDFVVRAWFRSPNKYPDDQALVQFSNTQGERIVISYREGYENVETQEQKSYLKASVFKNDFEMAYFYSEYVPIQHDPNYYVFHFMKQNGEYQLSLNVK